MNIGLKIKKLRIEKGLTQEILAEKTDLTARTIQRIENGEVDPRAHSLRVIANTLDVDFKIFLENGADEDVEESQTEASNGLTLIHLSGLFLLFLPTIILWRRKKNTIKGITKHFRDVVSLQVFGWLFFILPGLFIIWKVDKPHYLIIGLIMHGIGSIGNALNVFNNKPYQYSFQKLFKKK